MKCPACSNVLQQVAVGDVTVDVCKGGCGGIWFDNFELKKFDNELARFLVVLDKVHEAERKS